VGVHKISEDHRQKPFGLYICPFPSGMDSSLLFIIFVLGSSDKKYKKDPLTNPSPILSPCHHSLAPKIQGDMMMILGLTPERLIT
jgi:hypothetical protein